MDAPRPDPAAPRPSLGIIRALAATLSVPFAMVFVVGIWVQVVLLGSGGLDAPFDEALDKETVTVVVGERLGEQLVDLYSANLSLVDRAPEALREEAEMLDRAIAEEIRAQSTALASTPAVRAAVGEAAASVHSSMIEAVTRSTDGADVVEVNLVPTAVELFRGLQDAGVWPDTPVIEPVDPAMSPEDQRRRLEDSLGFDLPSDLAAVTLFDTSPDDQATLDTMRDVVSLIRILTWFSLVAWLGLLGAAAVRRKERRGSLMTLLFALAASALAIWGIMGAVPSLVASTVDDPLWGDATRDITWVLVSPLRVMMLIGFAFAVVVIVGVFVRQRWRSVHAAGET